MILIILWLLAAASASPTLDNKDNYKGQYCTDPRTMRKHPAYTEWADAYSCTRHRCQPGGRNLAIYTVGCKRVEAPESAIECEEVVEDTNMQFPFCCTRLRCLVVVRGEVWTRVLGQPWEVLPAAPWSHMYKMKKPPPTDTAFLSKTNEQGPVYELSDPENEGGGHDKMLRSGKKLNDNPDCNDVVPRSAPAPPDIVIALSTSNDLKESSHKKYENRRSHIKAETSRHKRIRKTAPSSPGQYFDEDQEREKDKEKERQKHIEPEVQEIEESPIMTEKSRNFRPEVVPANTVLQFLHPVVFIQKDRRSDQGLQRLDAEGGDTPLEASEERDYLNTFGMTQKPLHKNPHHQAAWTEIPQSQWSEHEGMEAENKISEPSYHPPEFSAQEAPEQPKQLTENMITKEEKPSNLQALVDAIGTRMRDIENVVQRMSEKVHQAKPPTNPSDSNEKRMAGDDRLHEQKSATKRPSIEGKNYKRFSVRSRDSSKYLHSNIDLTTEQPLFVEDSNLTGYFSDASNSILRRNKPPKEPPPTYMAPVENRRKAPVHIAVVSDNSEETEKKRKKHGHKKRRNKSGRSHKKHHKDDKRKHFNKLISAETEKNGISLEDSSAIAAQ